MTDDDPGSGKAPARVLPFPQSRLRPPHRREGFNDLGPSNLAQQFGAPMRQGTGHWCSRCHGIWYGYLLEVACPVCGSRHG